MKKTAAFIIALLWVLTAIPAVSAAEQDEQLDISAPSAMLMHPSGKVLYEKALKEGKGTKLNLWDKPYLY